MKSFTFFICSFAAIASVMSSAVPKLNFMSKTLADELTQEIKDKGCKVNVCFALDGSGSVSASEFDLARFFAQDVASLVGTDNNARFGAVQYGTISYPIIPLTSDRTAFAEAMENVRTESDPDTSMGSGIVYCDGQLARFPSDANKMVVLGDGRNNFGGSPVRRADNFRRRDPNGEVCSVGVGYSDTAELQLVAGGDPDKVLTVDEYIQLQSLLRTLVLRVCRIDLV